MVKELLKSVHIIPLPLKCVGILHSTGGDKTVQSTCSSEFMWQRIPRCQSRMRKSLFSELCK